MHTVSAPRVGGLDRRTATALVVGAVASCAVIALFDPDEPGRYPACPTATLLGIECPACGTLRGLHALTRGRLFEALGHNVLLLVVVPLGGLGVWRWARVAAGRPAHTPMARWPARTLPVVLITLAAFTVARNLPLDALRWLAA